MKFHSLSCVYNICKHCVHKHIRKRCVKFIFRRTSCEPGESEQPTVNYFLYPQYSLHTLWRFNILGIGKTADEHRTHWTANILCVCRKNWLEMVHNELFANPSFIGTNYTNIVFASVCSFRTKILWSSTLILMHFLKKCEKMHLSRVSARKMWNSNKILR